MAIDPKNLAGTAVLTFSDEFDSLSLWDGRAGVWGTNWWYNDTWGRHLTSNGDKHGDELQWYINANYALTANVKPWTVSDGVLSLTVSKASIALQPLIDGYRYVSGEINSWHSFSQTYGYFEMRAKVPAGQGLWPAFWLMPEDGASRPELDVMEMIGSQPDVLVNTVHSNLLSPVTDARWKVVGDMSTDFHTFGVSWDAQKIVWYFDGRVVQEAATPADMNKPMFIIANLALGGSWAGPPNGATEFPASFQIDYIRAYASLPVAGAGADAGDNVLIGGEGPDRLFGMGGADTLVGAGGDDYLRGDDGDDSLNGGAGFDDLHGNAGDDTLQGGDGPDWVVGGKGHDRLWGDAGADLVLGNLGDDTLDGGAGGDIVRGGQGDDVLKGGPGDDWLSGDRGRDTLTGGEGADTFHIFGEAGLDYVTDFRPQEGDRVLVEAGATYVVSQQGADVSVWVSPGGQMLLAGVSLASLTGDWLVVAA